MKKYYNFETMFKQLRDELRQYLKENNIYHEISAITDRCAHTYYHFEILTDTAGADQINRFIDSVTIVNWE